MANSEKNVIVEFEGYEIDIFICDNGNLGMTVHEFNKTHNDEDAKSTDIIVDKFDLSVHSC